MVVNEVVLAFVLLAGIVVTLSGYSFFRYSVVISGAVGGFFLGNIFFKNYLSGIMGEGVFRETSGNAGASFVIAFIMIAAVALSWSFPKIMAIVVGGVGCGFFFSSLGVLVPGAGPESGVIGFFLGVFVGAIFGYVAAAYEKMPAIVFTSLCGARILSYAGAKLLLTTSIGATIGNPIRSWFSLAGASGSLEFALLFELFVAATVIGIVVQSLTRAD